MRFSGSLFMICSQGEKMELWDLRIKKHRIIQRIDAELYKLSSDAFYQDDINYQQNSIDFIHLLKSRQSSSIAASSLSPLSAQAKPLVF